MKKDKIIKTDLIFDTFRKLKETKSVILINSLLDESKGIIDCFNSMEIPYKIFTPLVAKPYEINVCFGYKVEAQIIYNMVRLIDEIYSGKKIYIYISYSEKPQKSPYTILIGSYIVKNYFLTNISKPINPNEILKLKFESISNEIISEKFQNEIPVEKNSITYATARQISGDYDDNFDDSNNDWERDTFNFLTEGSRGNYDDWIEEGGNLDDLKD